MKYVCYFRVSTKSRGKSGLGLGDRKMIVERFLREGDVILEEYKEVESGENVPDRKCGSNKGQPKERRKTFNSKLDALAVMWRL
jgi:hypothetical protein